MRTTRVLTLDCGAAHVACGLFSAADGRLVLERFCTRPVVPSELKDEDWVAAVGAALRELGGRQGFHGACVLGLPGHLTFNRLIRVPAVSAHQRRQILRFEEGQGLPRNMVPAKPNITRRFPRVRGARKWFWRLPR